MWIHQRTIQNNKKWRFFVGHPWIANWNDENKNEDHYQMHKGETLRVHTSGLSGQKLLPTEDCSIYVTSNWRWWFHPKWTLRSWQRNYLRGTVFLLTHFCTMYLCDAGKSVVNLLGDHQVSVQNQALLIRHSFPCGIWSKPFFESTKKAKKTQGKMATLSDNLFDFCTKCIIYHLGKSERNYVR